MIPHEIALVKRMEKEPFALIGINSDGEADKVLPRLQKKGIAWRNAIDVRPDGDIGGAWNIQGWPTLFLLDTKGVIRYKWLGSPGDKILDARIDELVAEAKGTAGKK
jgi:hypothetical protein